MRAQLQRTVLPWSCHSVQGNDGCRGLGAARFHELQQNVSAVKVGSKGHMHRRVLEE